MRLARLYGQTSLYTPYEHMQQRLRNYLVEELGPERAVLGALKPEERAFAENIWETGENGRSTSEDNQKFNAAIKQVGTYLHDHAGVSNEEGEREARELALAMRDDYWDAFQLRESIRRAGRLPDASPQHLKERDLQTARPIAEALAALPSYVAIETLQQAGGGERTGLQGESDNKVIRDFVGRVIYRSLVGYASVDGNTRAEPRVEPIVGPKDDPETILASIKRYYENRIVPLAERHLRDH